VHGKGGFFPPFSLLFTSDHVDCGTPRRSMQPAKQGRMVGKVPRVARELHENFLRDIFRAVRVTAHLAPRGRIYEVDAPLYELPKGGLIARESEVAEQLGVGQ
jgi:hypothetical protein